MEEINNNNNNNNNNNTFSKAGNLYEYKESYFYEYKIIVWQSLLTIHNIVC